MFTPEYTITPEIAQLLMRIEAVRQAIDDLPMTITLQKKLRETAQLLSTHYSTQIEGNRLNTEEAKQIIYKRKHIPDKKRDEQEIIGYYRALDEIKNCVSQNKHISEKIIQRIHSIVISGKNKGIKISPYRESQNVIKDSRSGHIVYLPPEAKDVPQLMRNLAQWIKDSHKENIPIPIIAGIAHYQFVTIHPYYDGNGRTARLLTTYIMHWGGYDLKGFYSLDEYYARDLKAYYNALAIGESHNYYLGRAHADITSWIYYFCHGAAVSFEKTLRQAESESQRGKKDKNSLLKSLDARQRKILQLFVDSDWITSKMVADLFTIKPRTSRDLCAKLEAEGFLMALDESRKNRKYGLTRPYQDLVR